MNAATATPRLAPAPILAHADSPFLDGAMAQGDAAVFIGCGLTTLRDHIREGTLAASKLGRKTVVARADLVKLLEKNRIDVTKLNIGSEVEPDE
jgi:excisionase family DNA binding protein